MSGGKVFLDTNVFVYMYDASEPIKKEISLSLLDANECVTSTQAINEFSEDMQSGQLINSTLRITNPY